MKITFLIPPSYPQRKAPDRCFGCLVKGSLVLSNPSVAPIENLDVGNKVLTHDGSYKEISFVNSRKIDEDIVKIRVKCGTPKFITKEHPVLIFKDNRMEWMPSGEVKVGDKLTFPINRNVSDIERITIDTDLFHNIKEMGKETSNISEMSRRAGVSRQCIRDCLESDKIGYKTKGKVPHTIPVNNDLMLYFGYYLAEGSVSLRKNKGGEIVFSFNENEKQYHDEVVRITKEIFGLDATIKKERSNCVTIHIHSRPLAEFLKKQLGNGAKNKKIDKWMLELPLEKQSELIKGLFRGDGYSDKHSYEIATSSRLLAYQIKQMLLRFNILCSIKESAIKDGRRWFRVRIFGKFIDVFNDIVDMKHPDSSRRLNTNIEFLDRYVLVPVVQRENIHFKGDVFNIQVSDNESYVLDDFVVHNCNYGVTFQQPVHILYPAATLEKAGFKVEFVDCPVEKKSRYWCEDYIKNGGSDAFVFFTVYLAKKTDLYWMKKIRELRDDAFVVFMGPEPTRTPEEFLLDSKTFVVRGEPEYTILELFKKLKENQKVDNVLGLSWIKDRKISNNPPRHFIEDLDKLPFPSRHLIRTPERYFNPKLKGRPTTTMFTSRQCWGNCIYCIPAAYNFAREIEWKRYNDVKPPVRVRSPKNIYEEFKQIKKQGYKSIAIMDDNFMGLPTKEHEKRIIKLCEMLKLLKMEWGILARADQLQDEEVLQKMKDAGCVYADIGVESFDKKILDYVRKGISPGEQVNAILLLEKVGIEPKVNILLGASPLQNEKDIRWTVEILKKLNIDFVSFGIVAPHPCIDFYKVVKKNKWFATKSKDWVEMDPYNEAIVDFPDMSHEKLIELVKWSYKAYYLRPSYLIKRLRKIKSFHELYENAKVAFKLFIS